MWINKGYFTQTFKDGMGGNLWITPKMWAKTAQKRKISTKRPVFFHKRMFKKQSYPQSGFGGKRNEYFAFSCGGRKSV
jgi:hypothetical protein